MQLRCKHIIVTGGGSGIGKAIALRLLRGGAEVVITGRNMEKLERVCQEANSVHLHCLAWDVTDCEHHLEKIEEASVLMGGFDGLVNSAAIGSGQCTGRGYEPWDITLQEWDTIMDTDLRAVFFLMRTAIDKMIADKTKGNILNIASNAACMDIVGSYGAAKLSLIRLTRALGKRFGSDGIIINGIAPGATFTPMINRYAKNIDDPYPRHAIGRFIRPEEIAELAAYLMSDMGEIICGHTVIADGGDKAATL